MSVSRLPGSASPSRAWLFPAAVTASAAVALLLAAGLEVRRCRVENAGLREEIGRLRSGNTAPELSESPVTPASGEERETTDSSEQADSARAETSAPVPATVHGREKELEEVIVFLRGEIRAAQETIERLKAGRPQGVRETTPLPAVPPARD